MDGNLVAKIEKAMLYAQEPERITFDKFEVIFDGNKKTHKIVYDDGCWTCDCQFFQNRGVCSHVMTLERILIGSVEPCEAIPIPA